MNADDTRLIVWAAKRLMQDDLKWSISSVEITNVSANCVRVLVIGFDFRTRAKTFIYFDEKKETFEASVPKMRLPYLYRSSLEPNENEVIPQ